MGTSLKHYIKRSLFIGIVGIIGAWVFHYGFGFSLETSVIMGCIIISIMYSETKK